MGAEEGFTFSEVEAVLARLFGVADVKRGTFVARLQQLQRLGLPRGANPGRSKRVRYHAWQLAELALYLDLIDVGLTPNLIATHFASNSILASGYFIGTDDQGRGAPPTGKEGQHLILEMHTLAYLQRAQAEPTEPHPADHDIGLTKGAHELLRPDAITPAIVINLSKRLEALKAAVREVVPSKAEPPSFFAA